MDKRFVLYKVDPSDDQSFVRVLQECLAQSSLGANSPRYFPLWNCIDRVRRSGSRAILRQSGVQDPDFMAEHSAYYSRWTTPVSRYCERLHFFDRSPEPEDPIAFIDKMSEFPDAYLGFVTLRPISISPVAASILVPPLRNPSRYLLSQDGFEVNIAGRSFLARGTPFLQQDNAVGACAQASIWMALRTMRKKEGQPAYSPAQITTAATRFYVLGRTLPNRTGLHLHQVAEAVRSAGYSPHLLPLKVDNLAARAAIHWKKRVLYPYVESGIPVLLILAPENSDRHAVVLIGHGWEDDPEELISVKKIPTNHWKGDIEILDAAGWVEPFLIHNDNTGPYMDLPAGGGGYNLSQAEFAIPLLKPDVFIDGAEAQEASLRLLEDILGKLGDANAVVAAAGTAPKLVMRTYLQERSEFRASVVDAQASADLKNYYRMKWLPRRFWVTELNLVDQYAGVPSGAQTRVGEILLDAAAEAEDGAFLSIRLAAETLPIAAAELGGIIVDRSAMKGTIRAFPISGSFTSPLVRHGSFRRQSL